VDREGDQLKTALANHLDVDTQITVHERSVIFGSFEDEFNLDRTDIVGKQVAKSLQTGKRQATLEGNATIGQFARVNVRWNRVIQHRRDILGMPPGCVKGNSAIGSVTAQA
jgi:hypothetical protein